jgi:hypothetical protein
MKDEWLTKQLDMLFVKDVITEYGGDQHLIGIFEVGLNEDGELKQVRLSEWVQVLTQYFNRRYGIEKAENIMKKLLSESLIGDNTIH